MENEKAEGSVYNGEEEKKVEEFFALIRRFHEARNRRRGEIMKERESRKKKIRRVVDEGGKSSWVPSFAWEDFAAEMEFRESPHVFPPGPGTGPKCGQKLKDEMEQVVEEDHGLDLNLTL